MPVAFTPAASDRSLTMSTITGRSALVTGGGSGIGLAAATRLAGDGAHVAICGRTEDKLAKAAEAIGPQVGEGGSIRHVVADVTVEDQVAAAVAFAAEPTGGLDILFANAGGSLHLGAFDDADADAIRATVDLNLVGTMLCIKHAVPAMKAAGGGSIIGMSSGAGHFPHRWLWAYGAAKAGIDMVCRYAAEELGADGDPGQQRPARHRRRRADGADHRGREAARRLPRPGCRSGESARSRTSRPPSGSWPGPSRRGSPG